MKHSRVYLGMTTVLLAIAGIAVAKVHRFSMATVFYVAGHSCVPLLNQTHCALGQSFVTCYYVTQIAPSPWPHARLTLYTQRISPVTCGNIATYELF